MATKKKLVEMDGKHKDWLKKSSRELGMYEKDIIYQVFEYAIKNNALETFKKRAVTSELQKTLEQLSAGAKNIAALQERSERLLKEVEETDGK
jgi:hypothetical protein